MNEVRISREWDILHSSRALPMACLLSRVCQAGSQAFSSSQYRIDLAGLARPMILPLLQYVALQMFVSASAMTGIQKVAKQT